MKKVGLYQYSWNTRKATDRRYLEISLKPMANQIKGILFG